MGTSKCHGKLAAALGELGYPINPNRVRRLLTNANLLEILSAQPWVGAITLARSMVKASRRSMVWVGAVLFALDAIVVTFRS